MRNFPEQIVSRKKLLPNFICFLGFCFEMRSYFAQSALTQEVILKVLHSKLWGYVRGD